MFEEEAIETGMPEIGDGTPAFENGVPTPQPRPAEAPQMAIDEEEPAPKPQREGFSGGIQNVVDIASDGKPQPIKRILSYLMGEGAAQPQEINVLGSSVDPTGQMPASTRNVLAVERAAQAGGPEAAWKIVQGNRVAFNAKQAFGYAALNGTAQKPPDLNAAIDAANQAQSHILDGSDVQFAPAPGGVTATVTGPDGQPQQLRMTLDQFRAYLNVGGEGQWDKLMETGVPAAIKKLATGQMSRLSQMQPLRRPPKQQAQVVDAVDEEAIPTGEEAPQESTRAKKQDRMAGSTYSPALQEQARRLFPWASQAQQAEAWMAQQQGKEAERQNKVDVARETGLYKVGAADARAQGGIQQQQLKNEGGVALQEVKNKGWKYASDSKVRAAEAAAVEKAADRAARNNQAEQSRALKLLQTKMMTMQDLTPQEQAMAEQITQRGTRAPDAAPVQQQGAAPAKPGQPPVPGAKFYKGNWYTRGPNGESVPVQQ